MPTLRYEGVNYPLMPNEDQLLADHVMTLVNSGQYEWLEIGQVRPTRLLIGPGIPMIIYPDDLQQSW